MKPSAFGARLYEARMRAGIAARELSRRAGLSGSAVRQVEIGDIRCVRLDAAIALAEALGVSLEWLAYGKKNGPGPEAEAAA